MSSATLPHAVAAKPAEAQTIVQVEHLTRRFGRRAALDDVSLSIRRGMVFGLVGENGAGKTTLIRHLLGLLRAKQGSVRVFGLDPVLDPVGVLGRVGYLSEDRDLPDWMTITQLIRYNQAFYPAWDNTFAERLRGDFELDPDQQIRRMSRGQRARAGLLAALAHRPDLLVLDEPSSGLDPVVRGDILTAIIRTVADEGRTVLFSSHLLDEVERVADHVAFLRHGRVALSAPLSEILESHRRLVLRFADSQSARPELPGALSLSGAGHEWTVVTNGQIDALRAAAARLGAEIVDETAPSLDEIFVARSKMREA
ncbi:MAG TPA: ATP-binding cassette domain-containing protein [Pirellulales bacterium]|nr:ATP-binding cassette domain-containing protein [Pirellulales bacterium]